MTQNQTEIVRTIFDNAKQELTKKMDFDFGHIADIAYRLFQEKCETLQEHIGTPLFEKEGVIYAKLLLTDVAIKFGKQN